MHHFSGVIGAVVADLIHRLSAVHPNHKRIASGALRMGAFVLLAKLFVAGREVAVAWRYGVSGTVDSYQLALTLTTWLPMMLIGVTTVVVVPRLVALRQSDAARSRFIRELNGTVLLVGVAVTALTWLAVPLATEWLAGDAVSRTARMTTEMAKQMSPIALLVIGAGYLAARLQSRERYAYSAAEAVPAAAIALFVLVPFGNNTAAPLIWGTIVGYLLQLILLMRMTDRGDPPLGGVGYRHRSAEWATLYGSLSLMALGQALLSFSIPIDQAFGARLGEGAVAMLGYANRIITLITGLGTVVLARALLPVLSGEVARGDQVTGSRHALQWAWLLLIAGTAIAGVGWLLAPGAVSILFERGAFSASDTDAVALVLRFGLLQVPFYFAGLALVQWNAATGRFGLLLFVAFLAIILKTSMNLLLLPLGLAGIMMATAGMYAFSFFLQYAFVVRNA